MSLRRLASLAAAGLLALPAAQAAGTLTVCLDGSPDGFDIAQYETGITFDGGGVPLYDSLTRFKPGGTEVVPGLAEKWEISPDGRVYTFTLRQNVAFHTTPWFTPSRPLNADDVLFSFERMRDKKHWAYAAAKNGYVYWDGMGMSGLIQAIEKLDDRRVRFTLTRPEAPFLADLAILTVGPVLSAEYAAQLQKAGKLQQLNTQPVGTGPFVFKSYQKDAVIRYVANAGYWGGAPKVDNLVFAITPDPDVQAQRVKAGECLIGVRLKSEAATALEGDRNVDAVIQTPLATAFMAPNVRKKPMSDLRFREGLWMALDKRTLLEAFYHGRATAATSFLPPAMWGFDKSLADRHDPEKAKALIQESGYDGREITLFSANRSDNKRATELIQNDWAKAGVKVKVQLMELGEMFVRAGRGDHDVVLLSWNSDNGDPDNFLTPNLSCSAVDGGGNKSRWCSQRFDTMLDEARRTLDPKRRLELYTQAQQLVYKEVAVIPVAYPQRIAAVNKRVQGFVSSPFGIHDFSQVSLK